MVGLVECAKERGQTFALRDSLLRWIETGLDKAFIQAIDTLYRCWVGERQTVGTQPDDITMLPVELDVCYIWSSVPYVDETPGVGDLC